MARSINEQGDRPKAARGRKPKAQDAGLGHNSEPLTEEELEALQTHHELAIRAQQRKAAQAKTLYDAEREEVNSLFKRATADLKFTRKEFEEFLSKKDMTASEYLGAEKKRAEMFRRGGLPVVQGDLFADRPDTVSEQSVAYEDGFRAGKRADDPVPPSYIAAVMHQDWMRGWHDGQADNAKKLGLAEEVIARRAKPAAHADGEPEDEGDPQALVESAARRLKKNGFMERTPETMAAE